MKALAVRPDLTREILMEDDDEATNPTLSEEHLALLGARGEERVLADEELLYRPGEPYEHVYVVLDGEILILDGEREDARVIAELGRGKFLGEYGLLVGGMGLNVAGRSTRLQPSAERSYPAQQKYRGMRRGRARPSPRRAPPARQLRDASSRRNAQVSASRGPETKHK